MELWNKEKQEYYVLNWGITIHNFKFRKKNHNEKISAYLKIFTIYISIHCQECIAMLDVHSKLGIKIITALNLVLKENSRIKDAF